MLEIASLIVEGWLVPTAPDGFYHAWYGLFWFLKDSIEVGLV